MREEGARGERGPWLSDQIVSKEGAWKLGFVSGAPLLPRVARLGRPAAPRFLNKRAPPCSVLSYFIWYQSNALSSFSCEVYCQCLLRLATRRSLAFAGSAAPHLDRTLRPPSLVPSTGSNCSFRARGKRVRCKSSRHHKLWNVAGGL